MAVKLTVWNAALGDIGERRLTDTGDVGEDSRALTAVWDDVVEDCLESGLWNFAKRTSELAADTGITPNFGPTEIIAKPTDWVRTMKMSTDENFSEPYLDYTDEVDYWASNATPLYCQYVSNDSSYGLDLTKWPRSFTRYVELELALRVASRMTQSGGLKNDIQKDRDKAKRNALNKDAMNEATMFPPEGSWTRARRGTSRRERGNTNSFTG